MEDLIKRQAAVDALNEYFARIGKLKRRGLTKGEIAISLDAVGIIKALPSAQSERTRGRWIPWDGDECYECSVCRVLLSFRDGTPEENDVNFCPHCGADMSDHEGKE